jgi:uridine kinase
MQAPEGIHVVCKRFPKLKIVTSEIDSTINEQYLVVPGMGEFGDRYFGTDEDNGAAIVEENPVHLSLRSENGI